MLLMEAALLDLMSKNLVLVCLRIIKLHAKVVACVVICRLAWVRSQSSAKIIYCLALVRWFKYYGVWKLMIETIVKKSTFIWVF